MLEAVTLRILERTMSPTEERVSAKQRASDLCFKRGKGDSYICAVLLYGKTPLCLEVEIKI